MRVSDFGSVQSLHGPDCQVTGREVARLVFR